MAQVHMVPEHPSHSMFSLPLYSLSCFLISANSLQSGGSGSYSSGHGNSNTYSGGQSNGYSSGYGGSSGAGGYGGYDSYGASGDKMANIGAGLKKPTFDLETLPKFEKNFYREADSVKRRSEREIEDFRHKQAIRVAGKHIPRPVETFDEAGFPSNSPPPIPFALLNQV